MKSAVVALCLVLLCCSSAWAWPHAVIGVGVYAPVPYAGYYGAYYPPSVYYPPAPSVYYPPAPLVAPAPVVVAPPVVVPRVVVPRVVVPAPVVVAPRVYYARPVRPFVRAVIW